MDYHKPTKEVLHTEFNIKTKDSNDAKVFTIENLQQEVKKSKLPLKEKSKLNKMLKTLTASASTFIVAIPVSAQETTAKVTEELPSTIELAEMGQWLIGYTTIVIIVAGIVWVVASRVLHFFPVEKYRKMALDIAQGTLKGITEALTLPTIFLIIIGIAYLLFGGFASFNLPL